MQPVSWLKVASDQLKKPDNRSRKEGKYSTFNNSQRLLTPVRLSLASPSQPPPLPLPSRVAQSVTCLATDASLTADPGVASSIPARSHTFVEIDHEIISTVVLLPSAESFKKGCCQLQAKLCARSTGYLLVQACPGKKGG